MRIKFYTLIIVINLLIISGRPVYCQDLTTTGSIFPQPSPEEIIEDNNLKTILEGKKEVEKTLQEAALEKSTIDKEKSELLKGLDQANSNAKVGDVSEKIVILEKLETVKKKENIIALKEDIARKKNEEYERITQLIEQKLNFMRSENNRSLYVLNLGISKSLENFDKLERDRLYFINQKVNIQQEIKLLQQDIAAKKILNELKEDPSYLLEAIQSEEDQLLILNAKLQQFDNSIELIDIEKSIVQDYLVVLKILRNQRINKDLLTPKSFQFDTQAKNTGLVLFFLLVILTAFTLKARFRLIKLKIFKSSFYEIIGTLLTWGWVSYLLYGILSLAGYHNLVSFIGRRILMSVGCAYLFVIAFSVYQSLLLYIFKKTSHADESQLHSKNPLHSFLTGIGWAILMIVIGSFILDVWGFQYGRWSLFKSISRFSFYKIGTLDISLVTLLKIGLIIWGLNLFSHFLNKFLHKNIYPKTKFDESAKYTISRVQERSATL